MCPTCSIKKTACLTFLQRFFVNEVYWQPPDGPVFLFIGGEGPIFDFDVLAGTVVCITCPHLLHTPSNSRLVKQMKCLSESGNNERSIILCVSKMTLVCQHIFHLYFIIPALCCALLVLNIKSHTIFIILTSFSCFQF